jgi:serine/threonine protein kinase
MWQYKIMKDRYIIIRCLGKGSFASVWLAYDVTDMTFYAIKISGDDEEDYESCKKESEIYNKIREYKCKYLMNSIRSFDIKEDDIHHHCIVMELMGESLYSYIKRCGPLNLNTLQSCAYQILIGLDTLHKNKIIHGDIKPENVLINEKPDDMKLLISKLNLEKKLKSKVLPKKENLITALIDDIKKVVNEIYEDNLDSSSEWSSDSSVDNSENISIASSTNSSIDSICENKEPMSSKEQILNVKICDMGGVLLDNKEKHLTTTNYYWPPEALLEIEYNEKLDMWSFGCTLYELYTKKILFNPDEYDGNQNKYHLYLISCVLGKIPLEMIKKSRKQDMYYANNGKRVRGFRCLDTCTLFDTDDENPISKIIRGCLKIDPDKRFSSKDCLCEINETPV